MKAELFYDAQNIGELVKIGKAFASETRVAILNILMERPMNLSEIAAQLNLPISSVAMHINILDEAGLLLISCIPGIRGSQKICSIKVDSVHIEIFATLNHARKQTTSYSMPIGNYFAFDISPPCGIASDKDFIGISDTVYSFYDPERTKAQILWFFSGWIEYRFPSLIFRKYTVESLELSIEICSEAPGYNMNWPSDLSIELNGVVCAAITLPGDYGDRRGLLNPSWWSNRYTQYGDLYKIRVSEEGTFVNEQSVSNVNISNLRVQQQDYLSFKVHIPRNAKNVGGLNLFGSSFGDHPQNIDLTICYHSI